MNRIASLLVAVAMLSGAAVASAQQQPARDADGFDQAVSAPQALNTRLPEIDFQGVAMDEAIDFLRDVSGANIHVNWRALEEFGVSRDMTVDVRLRGVTLRQVLNLLLAETGVGDLLTFHIDENVIQITTRELADQQLITRVYYIEDLLMEVPDFEGGDLNLQSGGGIGGGQGGGGRGGIGGGRGGGGGGIGGGGRGGRGGRGGGSGFGDEEHLTREERAEELQDLIMDTIAPDIWREMGGTASVRYYRRNLIVTAPPSVHEALSERIWLMRN